MMAVGGDKYARFRGDIAAILDERKWPLAWLDEEVATGRATVFTSDAACIVTCLRQYPGKAIEVHGLCAVGGLTEIRGLIAEAEAWGRTHGATMATISSRRGWARALKADGYAEHQMTIEKAI